MKRYNRCKRCGSHDFHYDERIAPINPSPLDTLGRILLLLIPVIGWIALFGRKNFITETYATCKQCGYRKDITTRTSLLTKIMTGWLIAFVVVFLLAMLAMTLSNK